MSRGRFLVFNNSVMMSEAGLLTSQNRSFLYGDGIFETIRCIKGQPLWIENHYERLKRSLDLLEMILPENFSMHDFEQSIKDLLQKNEHLEGARVRVTLFRKEGGFYCPADNGCDVLIESFSLEEPSFTFNKKGLFTGIYQNNYKPINALSSLKTTSALLYVMACRFAQNNGFDDALLLNDKGNIAEATSSNVFIVSDNKLITPSPDQGGVSGVMQQIITQIAMEEGYRIDACDVTPDDVLSADEMFLTNAVKGVQWVSALKNKRYYHNISQQLLELLNDKAEAYVTARMHI